MKLNFNLFLVVSYIIIFTVNGCKDNEPKCGCDSETTKIISESECLIGEISYKRQLNVNDNYFNNKYWIGYTEPNCSDCIHIMIVCNEEMLTEFGDLLNLPVGESVTVKFSGKLKDVCEKPFSPANYTYEHIVLTKIERQ